MSFARPVCGMRSAALCKRGLGRCARAQSVASVGARFEKCGAVRAAVRLVAPLRRQRRGGRSGPGEGPKWLCPPVDCAALPHWRRCLSRQSHSDSRRRRRWHCFRCPRELLFLRPSSVARRSLRRTLLRNSLSRQHKEIVRSAATITFL